MEPSSSTTVVDKKSRISELAKCSVCWRAYTSEKRAPVTLQCGHNFCRECVNELAKDNFKCGTCGAKQWQSANRLEKNRQFVELLNKLGVLEVDPPSEPTPAAANTIEAPRTPNQAEAEPDVMAEVEAINESIQRMSDVADDTLNRVRQIIVNFQGNREELYRIVSRIFRLLRELSTHPLQIQVSRMRVRQNMEMVPQLQRNPVMQAGIPAELMDDLALQAILLEQVMNARPETEANRTGAEQGFGNIQDAVQQNMAAFIQDIRAVRNPLVTRAVSSSSSSGSEATAVDSNTDVTTATGNELTAVGSSTDVTTAVENGHHRNINDTRTAVERGAENIANEEENRG